MPEAQLTEPLADTAEKGGFKEEMFAALKSAVEAAVDAFLLGNSRRSLIQAAFTSTSTPRACRRRRSRWVMRCLSRSSRYRPPRSW